MEHEYGTRWIFLLVPAIIFQGDWILLQATFNNFHMGFELPSGNAVQSLGSPFMSKAWVGIYRPDNSKTILTVQSKTELYPSESIEV